MESPRGGANGGRNNNNNNNNNVRNDERVTFITEDRTFLPKVVEASGERRDFEPEDMPRVLDYEGAIMAPPDGGLMFGLEDATEFKTFHFCLRGGFLFYFNEADVDDTSGPYVTYHGRPIGVIPLEGVSVEYPPGGRRVFREHAQTNAKTGYELVMLHHPTAAAAEDEASPPRPPTFIIVDSLGKREKWAAAIRSRADATQPTMLRAGYSSSTTRRNQPAADSASPSLTTTTPATPKKEKRDSVADKNARRKSAAQAAMNNPNMPKENRNLTQKVMEVSDDAELAQAVLEFGVAKFDEKEWMNRYFSHNNDSDAAHKCRQMEEWQNEMKRDLKGAVLEQYEYFVQASGEMTTMGHEVATLKAYIEKQAESLREMKTIEFLNVTTLDHRDEIMGRSFDQEEEGVNGTGDSGDNIFPDDLRKGLDERSFFSDMSSIEAGTTSRTADPTATTATEEEDAPPIEVPDWLDDVAEEIAGTARECRYGDAVDLFLKAKAEVSELLDKHERPTAYRLRREHKERLKALQRTLNNTVGERLSTRIGEALRRKNEALRQGAKRDRADAQALMSLPLSPTALKDDAHFLQLLVKMGKHSEAADAFAARRSLLLLETLNERPISGAGTVDLVIYAAQLSQSFFSGLASSVEGFLDLFLSSRPASSSSGMLNGDKGPDDEESLDASSLHSGIGTKNLPAGAVASIVLWCDAELAKFANAFGGARVLSNLALSPPPTAGGGPRVVGGPDLAKERRNALELAAQCIDQAFMYASRNLDTVGLPLTPRLAECLRTRLKGCEAELSALLDERWQHLTSDWRIPIEENGMLR